MKEEVESLLVPGRRREREHICWEQAVVDPAGQCTVVMIGEVWLGRAADSFFHWLLIYKLHLGVNA